MVVVDGVYYPALITFETVMRRLSSRGISHHQIHIHLLIATYVSTYLPRYLTPYFINIHDHQPLLQCCLLHRIIT
jgi:hypothetical protein